MEGFDVELRAELLLRIIAQLADGELAHFVGKRLPRPRYIPVGLGLRDGVVHVIGVHIVDHLFAAPVLVMNAGVDNQANRAEELGVQPTIVRYLVFVEADLLA